MNQERSVSRSVLDGGSVTLVGWLGDSLYPAQVARTSTGSKGDPERDTRLVRRLHNDRHTSPFEFIQFEFHVRAPIFVMRQWQRHRTASYNERSGRYSVMETEFYIPEEWRSQHDKNRQMSGDPITGPDKVKASEMYAHALAVAASTYSGLLEIGVSREQARAILPLSLYTEMRVSVDAHNLYHFLTLRTAEDAQPEIRVYADAIVDILGSMPEFRDLVEIWGFGEKDA
jgi:thymidylate synthase (FAD)